MPRYKNLPPGTPTSTSVISFYDPTDDTTKQAEVQDLPGVGGGSSTLVGLTDVAIASPTNGQALIYETATSKWKNATPSGSGDMLKSENLSGLANYATARTNLGLNTTANQTDTPDKRFMTDAQEAKLDAISGTNTGDNAVNSLYSGLVSNATHTGDVTGATALTIASGAVSLAKMANVATGTLFYRKTAGSGAPEVQTLATLKTDLALAKADVGLSNVDNTSDTTKNSATATLTNKTIISSTNVIEEITTIASSATPTPTGGSLRNFFTVTALAVGATFGAPSGTPVNGNVLIMRVKANGAYSLAYNAIYRAIGVTLPNTTVANKTMYFGAKYNSADTKWDIISYGIES